MRRWMGALVASLLLAGPVAACADGPSSTTKVGAQPATSCRAKPGQYSRQSIEAVSGQLDSGPDAAEFTELGDGQDAVEATLNPGDDALAAQIEARYGNEVTLTVGATPYCHGLGASPTCPALQLPPPGHDSLVLALTLSASSADPGDRLTGQLTVTNRGATPVSTGDPDSQLVASVVEPGTLDVVGAFAGDFIGDGSGGPAAIGPGQSATFPVIVGLDLCDGSVGSALRPGRYGVRVGFPAATRAVPSDYLSPEIPLTIH